MAKILLGPVAIGGTSRLLDIFSLLKSLRLIKGWLEISFRRSLEKWFQIHEFGQSLE
jgi:hypothetical protein